MGGWDLVLELGAALLAEDADPRGDVEQIDRTLHLVGEGWVRVVHLGRCTCHAISGRRDKSTRSRRGHLLSSQVG